MTFLEMEIFCYVCISIYFKPCYFIAMLTADFNLKINIGIVYI